MSSQSPNHDLPDPKRFKAAPATTNNTNTTTSSNIAPSTTTAPAAAAAPTVTSSISNQTTATARPVTASAATTVTTASSVKKASSTTTTAPPATTTSTTTTTTTTATGALQQQIQAQLQQQLQAQLQAAAARGQQANITPEQIQAQAQAMVQAAAQAQAVVSAAKNRGDGLVPMTAQQIAALSQIQAQAIVNARPQTALLASGTPTVDQDGKPVQPTPAQIQHQITLQAQALVHAHTQAQIAAGIYKGDGSANSGTGATTAAAGAVAPTTSTGVGGKVGTTAAAIKSSITTAGGVSKAGGMASLVGTSAVTTAPSVNSTGLLSSLTPSQLTQQNSLVSRQNSTKEKLLSTQATETNQLESKFQQQNLASAPTPETQSRQELELKALREKHQLALQSLNQTFQKELQELHTEFRKQNAAAEYAGIKGGSGTAAGGMKTTAAIAPQGSGGGVTPAEGEGGVVASATSPAFLEKLAGTLNRFWMDQLQQMRNLGTAVPQTEHDFKNHNDLPLARIKRIMKSDEDVRMISAEAPVLFAKACEMFILELTLRSWSYSENNKRRTLQKEDIKEAIQRTDIFDFLVDVIH